MNIKDFLACVTAKQGLYCVVFQLDNKWGTKFFDTLDPTADYCQSIIDKQHSIYFGGAKFNDNKRYASNAKYFKSLWLDVDCGEHAAYSDRDVAKDALINFCEVTRLPIPLIVNSKSGFHCYWVLADEIDVSLWKPLANSLRHLCEIHSFHADHSATNDTARIMRVPSFEALSDIVAPVEHIEYQTLNTIFNI